MAPPPDTENRGNQVPLSMFPNEPLARLAAQRLELAGVPSLVKSLQGGPGLWGSAYNLPHALYVFQSDEARSREILNLGAEEGSVGQGYGENSSGSTKILGWPLVLGVAAALLLIATSPVWTRVFQ